MTTSKPTASAEVVAWMMTCDQYRRPPEFSRDRPTAVPPICKVTGLVPLPDYEALQRRVAELEAALLAVLRQDAVDQSLGLVPTLYMRARMDAAGVIGKTVNELFNEAQDAAMRSKEEEHAD